MWLFLACAKTEYMTPPPELAGSADILQPEGHGPEELPATVGPWQIQSASCDGYSASSGTTLGSNWRRVDLPCAVTVANSDNQTWQAKCVRREEVIHQISGSEQKNETVSCTFLEEGLPWSLVLRGNYNDGWNGTLQKSIQVYTISSTYAINDNTPHVGITGLVVTGTGGTQAALDLVNTGMLWIHPALSHDLHGLLVSLSMIMSLYEKVGMH